MENRVFKLLFKIRKCPGLYLGKKSLEILKIFIDGYICAMNEVGLDSGKDMYYDFNDWVQKKYNIRNPILWDTYLPNICGNSDDAFELFYKELDLYINDVQIVQ